jgi:hypothetical protein
MDDYFKTSAAGLELAQVESGNQLCMWKSDDDHNTHARIRDYKQMKAFVTRVAEHAASEISRRIGRHLLCLNGVIAFMESSPEGPMIELSAHPEICGAAQAFVIWKWRLERFIQDTCLWVRRGWSPEPDESLASLLRIDMESLFYYGAQQVALLQSDSSFTMWQRYAAIRTVDCPRFSRPGQPFENDNGIVDVKYMFRLKDEGIFDLLRCDQGRYFQRRDDGMRNLIDRMVSEVHTANAK